MNPDNYFEMIITVSVLLIELALVFVCSRRMRQPVNVAKPRIFPYSGVMIILCFAILVTAAHTVSVYTGHRLEAKQKRPGQMPGQTQPAR
jgi:hypothetical protein